MKAQEKPNRAQVVKLQLKWKHQFQFAGYYAAIEKGYYEEAGIHIEFLLPDGHTNPIDVVDKGKADFGITGSGILLARSQTKKVVVLASIFQHSPFVFLVPQNSGITSLRDLKGKTLAMEPDSTELIAALNNSMVFPKPNNIIPLKYNAEQLLSGHADAIAAYITDEPFLLDSLGFQYRLLSPAQVDIDFYGDVLFTSENLINSDPELVEKFRQATLMGWKYAMSHPQEMIFLIYNKYSKDRSIKQLTYEAEKMKELIQEDFVEIGYSNLSRWIKILDEYKALGLIDTDFKLDGMLYEEPKTVSTFNFSWRLFALRMIILFSVCTIAYIFYRNSKILKIEIKNREKIQSELEKSEALYRSVIHASPDSIIITDLEGNIEYLSPQAVRMFDYIPEEILGRPLVTFIHPDDRQRALNNIGLMFDGNFTGAAEYKTIKSNGEILHTESNAEFIRATDGKLEKIIIVTRDISDRKNAEEKIKQGEKRFIQIVEQSQTVIWEVDADGLYTYVSPVAKAAWGYSPDDLIGKKHFYELHPEENREEFKKAALSVFAAKQSFRELGNPILNPNGKVIWVLTNGEPILDEQNNLLGYRGSDNDITVLKENEKAIKELNVSLEAKVEERTTQLIISNSNLRNEIEERKQVEIELQRAKIEAEQANLSKSEFLSRMSHELRTPMNSILGFAQLLEMGELTPPQKKGVQHILRSGKHLLNLINEVLDITRIEAGHLSLSIEPLQLARVISEIVDGIRPQTLEKQLSLKFKPSATNRQFVLADKQRLQQILINLLGNAIKYNKPEGKIVIETQEIAATGEAPAKIRISVIDTGIGISPEGISKLFNPFERIGAEQSAEEGTGLGLTVVKKLTEAMKGAIGVESVPEQGSTFWIDLLQAESQPEVYKPPVDSENNDQEGKKGTILYIEDNQSNIELVEQILDHHRPNIRLITTINGKETVQLAFENKPDLVILDLNLPDIHGSEVIKNLKNELTTQHIPVVVVSADAMKLQREKLKKLGAVDYMTKPINVQVFLNTIDNFFNE
ncbi:MAG: ABC transporter substrate-binding protein [Prolixibacteraceae bacterium]|nr:ABC transporter substrate-binding protein [Prolixibacteraceae bacterium]